MEFNESMIGKQVKEISTGDLGIVKSQCGLSYAGDFIWVDWDDSQSAWIALDEIVFTDDIAPFDEITINGKRYKLTPIE